MYNFYDEDFRKTSTYNNFIRENPNESILNIRTSAANEAIPIDGVRIIVSKDIDNYKVIFYDGITDNSGMINNIILPTPSLDSNDLVVPKAISYDIEAIYEKDNVDRFYKVLMYPGIKVIQNINIVPTLEVVEEVFKYGS